MKVLSFAAAVLALALAANAAQAEPIRLTDEVMDKVTAGGGVVIAPQDSAVFIFPSADIFIVVADGSVNANGTLALVGQVARSTPGSSGVVDTGNNLGVAINTSGAP